jgi:glycosyltransferase involved in cell wall biosynthesis
MLDYGYYPNNRVHHIVEQFKGKCDEVTVLYKKVYIPGEYSFVEQLKVFLTFRTKSSHKENVTSIEMDPLFNHIEGLGLNTLGIESPYTEVSSSILSFAKKALSNMGLIFNFAIVPSFLLSYILRVKGNIDVFIGQGPWEVAAGYILKKIGWVKVLVYDDFDYAPGYQHAKFRKRVIAFVEKLFMKRSDIIISVGKLLGDLREKQTGKKVEIIPNGVNYKLFSQAQDKPFHPPTLIYMGFVSDWSGVDLVLKALPMIKENFPEIRFVVVGHTTPGYLSYINNISKKLKLGNSFVYLGNKNYVELVDHLRRADIGMALFRPVELRKYAFSLKVIEYMAAGIPVITTKGTQSGLIVETHKSGEAIDFNIDELASSVCSMLIDKEQYQRYSENSRSSSSRYDWEVLMNREYELIKTFYNRENPGNS